MRRKCVGLFLAGVMVSSSCLSTFAKNKVEIESLSGKNRYGTAIGISRYGWQDTSKDVIIVNSDSVADALAVGPLARIKDAPVLLSARDGIGSESMAEIDRLKPESITLIGGEGSLSRSLALSLEAKGYKVDRIAGINRNDTSYKIADKIKEVYDEKNMSIDGLMVVDGYKGLADAAGAGAIAARLGYPLLMASKTENLNQSIANGLDRAKVYIVGGVASSLSSYFKSPILISGSNRTRTNVNLIKEFYPEGFTKAYIAKDGKNNPSELIDSVAIGGLAARESAPVILLNPNLNVEASTKGLIGESLDRVVKISGGIDLQVDQMLGNTDIVLPIEKPSEGPIQKPRPSTGTKDRASFDYWNEANKYSNDILMTSEKIRAWNRENLKKTGLLRDPLSVANKTYGVMTRREIARLKPGYPGNVSFDSTANTALNPWETIYIESYSPNRQWAYVKSYNSYGWLPVDSFAITSKEDIRTYEAMPFSIIKNRQYLNGTTRIDMGNRMPMEKNMVLLPVRMANGKLTTRKINFDSGSMNRGYLPLTRANIVKQALKFQNEVYGWGGSKNAHDCSSLVQDVFKSMGVMIPRDSKDQEAVNFGHKMSMRGALKLAKLDGMKPGTVLYMKGHVMLYIGKDKSGKHQMVHQYAGHYENGRYIRVYSGKITPVTIGAEGGRTYLDNMRTAVDWIR
ncbi:cell wall-binding repeat-containing protein [Peptostreptococcus anaerobius]|uniref:cell wall-binding repeat-containing protein n=1 Tax=Peptostreptococcus anaerobius TaxID=1261 RepID=UPI00321B13A3